MSCAWIAGYGRRSILLQSISVSLGACARECGHIERSARNFLAVCKCFASANWKAVLEHHVLDYGAAMWSEGNITELSRKYVLDEQALFLRVAAALVLR